MLAQKKLLLLLALFGMVSGRCPAAPIGVPPMRLTQADRATLATIRSQAKADLATGVMPFWTRYTWDEKNGGFLLLDVDSTGRPVGSTDKRLVEYPRVIWSLAAAHEYGLRDRGYLALGKKAIAFMTTKMWDDQYGGFYEIVAADGTPTNTDKHLYCEEFMLYALAKYYGVSRDQSARIWAGKLFDVIQAMCKDTKNGGYREDFDRTWTTILPFSYGVGGTASGKTVNTHMHLMEGLTALVQVDPQPRYRRALADVVDLLMTHSVQPQGIAIEPFTMDWKHKPDGNGRMGVYYGHDVELAWMLMDAYHALGRPDKPARKAALALIDQTLANGFDKVNGGIGREGPRQGSLFSDPAYAGDRKQKEWWEQAEGLTAFIRAYHWTGDRKYLVSFEKQWSWVYNHQIDHSTGAWYSDVDWDTGANPVGHGDTYHDGRALMNVTREIDSILGD